MTDGIQSLILQEAFVPNRKMMISGEHIFTDKDLYTNFYGVSFFSTMQHAERNPYVSGIYSMMPGILEEFMGDGLPHMPQRPTPPGEMQYKTMKCVDKKFILPPERESKTVSRKFSCSYGASVGTDGNSVIVSYGTVLPNTLCITDGDTLTAQMPFSPFSHVTFFKNQRTLQSAEFPILRDPEIPPEDLLIDFCVTVKKLECHLDCDLCGYIDLEYSLDVGAAQCESAKMHFEISLLAEDPEESIQ
ncbi:MAG: hypothetical protein IKV97_06275 [Clostridia bacterium]|nr:hypothetical protein [Clostridia bacterium]